MIDESTERQGPQTELPKTPETITSAQRFQTTVNALFDHYKARKPTDGKTKIEPFPRYSITPDGKEKLLLRQPFGGGRMGKLEWIERSVDRKVKEIMWASVEPFASDSSGVPIFGEDMIIKRGDGVEYISAITEPLDYDENFPPDIRKCTNIQRYQLSNPDERTKVNGQLNFVLDSLTPFLPPAPKKAV